MITTARHLRDAIAHGELTAADAVEHALGEVARQDPRIGAFVEVTPDAARERAAEVDRSPGGVMRGVPFADKDLTARAGVPTRYGSRAFQHFTPDASDPLAAALDAVGGVSIGKTATPEFGMTGYTETAIGQPTRNPWDLSTGAGGSSGGAAAAVSAGMLTWAPASDGGGSIRIPAATCGVVGLKPSRGRLPIGSGMDAPEGLAVAGPIATTVADAAWLLDVLSGLGPFPFAAAAPGSGPFAATADADLARGMRVGVTTVSPWDDDVDVRLDADARAAVDWAATALGAARIGTEPFDWRPYGYAEMFRTLWRSSAARLPLTEDSVQLVEPITAWLFEQGRALPAPRLLAALTGARVFERETITAFAPYDAVLTPALAQSPRPVGWYDRSDPERNFAQQCAYAPYSSFVNVAGLPAITVPVVPDATGRPVSVQLVGRPGGEASLLAIAAALEDARGPLPRAPRADALTHGLENIAS